MRVIVNAFTILPMVTPTESATPSPPGLLRRLAAIVYDTLLLFALLFVATTLALVFTWGQAIEPNNPLFTTYLFLVAFFFFAWFWTHGGQTLGMRAWRIRVQQRDGSPITLWQALLRFLGALASWACLGLGFLWILFDQERQSWHDRFSETILVMTPRRKP